MKKFIISFMCILLFSCHPIAVTFASVTEKYLETIPLHKKRVSLRKKRQRKK